MVDVVRFFTGSTFIIYNFLYLKCYTFTHKKKTSIILEIVSTSKITYMATFGTRGSNNRNDICINSDVHSDQLDLSV
jgi:hypothetical protein